MKLNTVRILYHIAINPILKMVLLLFLVATLAIGASELDALRNPHVNNTPANCTDCSR